MVILGVMIIRIPHRICNDSTQGSIISRISRQIDICCSTRSETVIDEELEDDFERRIIHHGGESGELTVSLLWNTKDDLDLAVIQPIRGDTIYYKRPTDNATGGKLDVDKNRQNSEPVIDPVENIRWLSNPPKGDYKINVSFFHPRSTTGASVEFQIQVKKGDQKQLYNRSIRFTDGSFIDQNIDLYVD